MSQPTENRIRRFFVPQLAQGGVRPIELPPDEAFHARRVLRLKPGLTVELFDGFGARAQGKLLEVSRRAVTVEVGCVEREERLSPIVHLAFAVPKGRRLDWLLAKATELSAASLQPVIFARSVSGSVDLSESARRRWLGQCVSSAKQCGLNHLPEIRPPAAVDAFIAGADNGLRLLGDADPACTSIGKVLLDRTPATRADDLTRTNPQPVILLIGPEGGLTAEERSTAIDGRFQPVRLGRTTLRIETAAIALLAAVTAMG